MTAATAHLPPGLAGYLKSINPPEAEVLQRLRQTTAQHRMGKMHLAAEQAQLLAFLVQLIRAERCLEIGVFTGYSSTSLSGSPKIRKAEGDVRYAMMPVWILTTNYKGKPYTFMMNGQTGKFVGSDLPEDKFKAVVYPLIPAALVFAVVVCLGWLIFDL